MALVTSGCVSSEFAYKPPSVDSDDFKVVALVREEDDERDVASLISRELQRRGYTVSVVGIDQDSPRDTSAIGYYESRWVWDIDWYLFEVTVDFYEPDTRLFLGTAHAARSSLVRVDADKLVTMAFDEFLGEYETDEAE